MAISSYKVFLMKGSSATPPVYTKLVDIKDFPDLGGAPEMLETTTLSDCMKTFIMGIQNNDALEFTANYDKTAYNTIKGLKGTETNYAVWFGATESSGTLTPTGSEGQFSFKGDIDVYPVGSGVNTVVDMKITIAPTTVITFSTPGT